MTLMKKLTPFAAIAAALGLTLTLMAANQQAAESAKAKVGQKAPAFSLTDHNGNQVSLADHAGKIVVLEWFSEECPVVQRHYEADTMNKTFDKYKDKDVVWLAVNSSSGNKAETNKKSAERWSIERPILGDADGKVGKMYGAKTTPHMFVIDKQGVLVYAGAIDDDMSGRKGDKAVNYVAKALDELLAGESVSTAETRPYGCGVKY